MFTKYGLEIARVCIAVTLCAYDIEMELEWADALIDAISYTWLLITTR